MALILWNRHERADSTRPLAAAILTGGRASRLGGARKARLTVGGKTIIERQLEALRHVAAPIYAVTSAEGEAKADSTRTRRFPGRGALGGIYTAIDASPHDRMLVVGCDMPFLSAALITYMVARRRSRHSAHPTRLRAALRDLRALLRGADS